MRRGILGRFYSKELGGGRKDRHNSGGRERAKVLVVSSQGDLQQPLFIIAKESTNVVKGSPALGKNRTGLGGGGMVLRWNATQARKEVPG